MTQADALGGGQVGTRVGDAALDCGGGHGGRTGQVGTNAWPLPTFKVSVGAADDAPSRSQVLTSGIKAQRAAAGPPFKAGLLEDAVQALGLSSRAHGHGAGHHPGLDTRRDRATPEHGGRSDQGGKAVVGAGTDEGCTAATATDVRAGYKIDIWQVPRPAGPGGRPAGPGKPGGVVGPRKRKRAGKASQWRSRPAGGEG